jgi:hypothetical protein
MDIYCYRNKRRQWIVFHRDEANRTIILMRTRSQTRAHQARDFAFSLAEQGIIPTAELVRAHVGTTA